MNFKRIIEQMVEEDVYSVFLIAGSRPFYRKNGEPLYLDIPKVIPSFTEEIIEHLLHQKIDIVFKDVCEVNFSKGVPGKGRFRINAYMQRGTVALSIRRIKTDIPSINDLNLPDVIVSHIMESKGLILCTGNGSSGKSTTLASLVNHRNISLNGYILTIEDPIEYIFNHQKSVVAQREIGIDVRCMDEALSAAQLQTPDLTVVGEIRDIDTMVSAINFAGTGQLCISTLRTASVSQTIARILDLADRSQRDSLQKAFASSLLCIISQKLVTDIHGNEIAIYETLNATAPVREAIQSGNIAKIQEIMKRDEFKTGSQSFDGALIKASMDGIITKEVMIQNATNPEFIKKEINRHEFFGKLPKETESESVNT